VEGPRPKGMNRAWALMCRIQSTDKRRVAVDGDGILLPAQ